MIDVAGNWVLLLAFLPVWAVMAVALSLCSAGGIMLGLKCGSLMNLPLSEKVCYAAALQSNTWFEQSSYWFAHLGASFHS